MPLAVTPQSIWAFVHSEAHSAAEQEPFLASYYHASILSHKNLSSALSYLLAQKLSDEVIAAVSLRELIEEAYREKPQIIEDACQDIAAVVNRDPAINEYSVVLLYLKGFHALQGYRVAHYLWQVGRADLARYIQSRISSVLQVDIHPAARIGHGVMFDHATGIVVGETSVIENDVSILQSVTLGGTGKDSGDRHPKIREGVLIGAGAKILGNIEIGEGAKVGAGSVVLEPVCPHTTVVGVPAKSIGHPCSDKPALDMNQSFDNSDEPDEKQAVKDTHKDD